MRYLMVANIEYIEASPFLVALFYENEGYLTDTIIKPYESAEIAIDEISKLGMLYGQLDLELYTSTSELYAASLSVPGIAGQIKHVSDTEDTKRTIKSNEEYIRETVKIELNKPPLPKWRQCIVGILEKIITKINGGDKYGIY